MPASKKTTKSFRERRRLETLSADLFADNKRRVLVRNGKPVAWLVPYEQMRGIMAIVGDIVSYEPAEEWEWEPT